MRKYVLCFWFSCLGLVDNLLFTSSPSGKTSSKNKRLSKREQEDDALLDLHMAKNLKDLPVAKDVSPKKKSTLKDVQIYNQLCDAIINNNILLVTTLLDLCGDVNWFESDKDALLNIAVDLGFKNIVNELLRRGANVNLAGKNKWTPLMVAVLKNHTDIIQLLLDHGALLDLQNDNGWTASMIAIKHKNKDAIRKLFAYPVNLNVKSQQGWTALMIAAGIDSQEEVQWLLEKKVLLNEKNNKGSNALIVAVQNKSKTIAELLLSAGAAVNEQDNIGATALMCAVYNRDMPLIGLLLSCSADPNLQIYNGATPLLLAVQSESVEIVRELLRAGADPNANDGNGVTALMFATQKGQFDIIETLLHAGADPNVRDIHGNAVYVYAQRLQGLLKGQVKRLLKFFGEYLEVEDLESLIRKDIARIESEEIKPFEEFWQENKQRKILKEQEEERQAAQEELEAIKQERDGVKRLAIQQRQLERQEKLQRKKEADRNRLQKIEDEKIARKKQEVIELRKRVLAIAQKVIEQNGNCSKEQANRIQFEVNLLSIAIPNDIKTRCENRQRLFGIYDAIINIDHIINIRAQFKKVANLDQYKVIFTGGHFNQSIQNLIDSGFVTLKNRSVLNNGCIKYILDNNFDRSEFVKTVFPERMTIGEIVELIVNSAKIEESKEQDFLKNEIIEVITMNEKIKTRNVLKTDLLTENLMLLSCYPIIDEK